MDYTTLINHYCQKQMGSSPTVCTKKVTNMNFGYFFT